MRTAETQYIRGLNTRSESCRCCGHSDTTPPTNVRYEYGPLRAHVFNRDLGYSFELEPAARVFTAFRANEYGSAIWAKPRPIEPTPRSGKTVHSHTETTDTDERKEIFGYTARRVIIRCRETRDSQLLSESETDAWYIDPPAAWLNLHPPPEPGTFYYLSHGRDDFKFTEAGKRETGFVLLATRNRKFSVENQTGSSRVHESVHHQEVTEFSEAPLEPGLFVPPIDFKRVPQLSDGERYALRYRIGIRWEMLQDSLSLPNRIAKFTRLIPQ